MKWKLTCVVAPNVHIMIHAKPSMTGLDVIRSRKKRRNQGHDNMLFFNLQGKRPERICMKKLISFLILAVLITTGCSRSAENVSLETVANLPERITLEAIAQGETSTEVEKETVLETELPESEAVFYVSEKEPEETEKMPEIEESGLPEEESEAETVDEFDDSISETCDHVYEFSDTYIEELEDDTWKDLYVCPKCGDGYSVPHVFAEEEISEETDCSHDMIMDCVCQECGMDGLGDME